MKKLWMISDSDIERELLTMAIRILHTNVDVTFVSNEREAIHLLTNVTQEPEYVIIDTESLSNPLTVTLSVLLSGDHDSFKTSKIVLYGAPYQAEELKKEVGEAHHYLQKSYSFNSFCKDLQAILTQG